MINNYSVRNYCKYVCYVFLEPFSNQHIQYITLNSKYMFKLFFISIYFQKNVTGIILGPTINWLS